MTNTIIRVTQACRLLGMLMAMLAVLPAAAQTPAPVRT
jgi:hypothetical protein